MVQSNHLKQPRVNVARTNDISVAVNAVMDGNILCIATDTLYALTCDATNMHAVKSIYKIKGRDVHKKLPIFFQDCVMAEQYFVFSSLSKIIADQFWPGTVTLILDALPNTTNMFSAITKMIIDPANEMLIHNSESEMLTKMAIGAVDSITSKTQLPNTEAQIDLFRNSTSADNCGVAPVLRSSCTTCTLRSSAPYAPITSLPEASFERGLMDGFAIRVPRSRHLQRIIAVTKLPMIGTSANLSGKKNVTCLSEFEEQISDALCCDCIDMNDDGNECIKIVVFVPDCDLTYMTMRQSVIIDARNDNIDNVKIIREGWPSGANVIARLMKLL